jgi:hypothetical protein
MFESIFTDLISRHGGDAAFTPATLAVARTLAGLLAEPTADPATARTMIELERLLPTVALGRLEIELVGREPDLTKLSDAELHVIDLLLRKVRGLDPDAPIDLDALAPEQAAEHRKIEVERAALHAEQERRDSALRDENARLREQLHDALIANDRLTRAAPAEAADGDERAPGVPSAAASDNGLPGRHGAPVEDNVVVMPICAPNEPDPEVRARALAERRRLAGDRPTEPFMGGLVTGPHPSDRFSNKVS